MLEVTTRTIPQARVETNHLYLVATQRRKSRAED